VEYHGAHFEEAAVAFEPGAGLQDGKQFIAADHASSGQLSRQTTRMEAGQLDDEKTKAEKLHIEQA
jgi:hypothetical protein